MGDTLKEFGNPIITASSFSYDVNICCGNAVGIANSVSLYVPNYAFSVGILSFHGHLDSNEIYMEVVNDLFNAQGVPLMASMFSWNN